MAEPELDKPEVWLTLSDGKMAEANDLLKLGHWHGLAL